MMGVFLSPSEIFEIALEIERNGARFYRKAADAGYDKATRLLLLDLAAMEEEHAATFARLQQELAVEQEAEWYNQNDVAFQYLQSFASGQIFDAGKERELAPHADVRAVLEFALDRERESILFYLGIKEFIPRQLLGDKIERIIIEEMKHLAQLNKRRMELTAA
jgi:rubrerythrin